MKIHVVRQGDTLLDLTQKYNVPLERILEVNPDMHDEVKTLEVGEKVRIPTGKISLQRTKDKESENENSTPACKEPSPKLVGADTVDVELESEQEEEVKQQDEETRNIPNTHQDLAQPASFPYTYPWPYYGNYYPAVSHYPSAEFMSPPYYPVNYAPPYVAPYYHPVPATPPVPQASEAHLNSYYPDPTGYISVEYPECVPCSCYDETAYPGYYNEDPWKW